MEISDKVLSSTREHVPAQPQLSFFGPSRASNTTSFLTINNPQLSTHLPSFKLQLRSNTHALVRLELIRYPEMAAVVPEKKKVKASNLLLGAGLNMFEVTTLGQPLEVTKTTMAANRGDNFAGALKRIWGRGGVFGCKLFSYLFCAYTFSQTPISHIYYCAMITC